MLCSKTRLYSIKIKNDTHKGLNMQFICVNYVLPSSLHWLLLFCFCLFFRAFFFFFFYFFVGWVFFFCGGICRVFIIIVWYMSDIEYMVCFSANSFIRSFIDSVSGLITSFAVHHTQCWLAVGTSSGCQVCWDMRFQLPINTITHPTGESANQSGVY